jgi:hypothetical protein
LTVADLIKDCYSDTSNKCLPGNCCDYAYYTIANALNETLDKWGRDYRLIIRRGLENKIGPNGNIPPAITNDLTCTQDSEIFQPGYYYIPPPPMIEIKLEICKN